MKELRATATDDLDECTERFNADGFLLVRQCVDRSAISELLAGGMAIDASTSTQPDFYREVQRLEVFHSLAHDPALLRVVRALLGDQDSFVHPQRLFRRLPPNDPLRVTTPHQDFGYIRGSRRTITSWVPLRSCDARSGALRLLVGSHQTGLLPMHPSPTVAKFTIDVDNDDPGWGSTTFEPGDVLLFHSMTVHAATENHSERTRFSADYRHQPASEPILERFLKPRAFPKVPDWPELLADVTWPMERWLSVPSNVVVISEEEFRRDANEEFLRGANAE